MVDRTQQIVLSIISLVFTIVIIPILGNSTLQALFLQVSQNNTWLLVSLLVYSIHLLQFGVIALLFRKYGMKIKPLLIAEIGFYLVFYVFNITNGYSSFINLHVYSILILQDISPLIYIYTVLQLITIWSVRS